MQRSRSIMTLAIKRLIKLLEVFRFKHVKNRSWELNNSSGKLQLFGTLEGMKFGITAHFMPLGICFPLYSFKKKKVVGSLCILKLNILSRDEPSFEDSWISVKVTWEIQLVGTNGINYSVEWKYAWIGLRICFHAEVLDICFLFGRLSCPNNIKMRLSVI